jgi:hypothetical protein
LAGAGYFGWHDHVGHCRFVGVLLSAPFASSGAKKTPARSWR